MSIFNLGILITGRPGIGKSELALSLIQNGHALIADDAPQFYRSENGSIEGRCPEALQDLLEVRSLGILNIRALYGEAAIATQKPLQLIIHLENQIPTERLPGYQSQTILGLELPQITLAIHTSRAVTALVECASRRHILQYQGNQVTL